MAVCDPPRVGLHRQVLLQLLTTAAITRVVYVSCNPESLASNLSELCSPWYVKKSVRKAYWGPVLRYKEY